MSDLSDSLTLFIKKEGMSELLIFLKLTKKRTKHTKKYDFSPIFWANCSFFVSQRVNERFAQKKEWFAHLLIYHEGPERIAHRPKGFAHSRSRSFVLSDLSELLSRLFDLSDLSKWADEQWANERITNSNILYMHLCMFSTVSVDFYSLLYIKIMFLLLYL